MRAGLAGSSWRRNASGMRSKVPLPNSSFLEVNGVDAKKFLQGLCTNDMHNLKSPGDALAAALLTPKGRILAPIIMYLKSSAESGDNILVEVHKKNAAEIQRYLTIYRLRSKVTIKPIGVQCTVHLEPSEVVVQPMLAVKDPRSDILGTRILSSNTVELTAMTGESAEADAAWFDRYKLVHGIADGPELSNRIPLECNLDLLHYISFTKGCYVGQELTARTKFKGLVRKRLVPFLLAADSSTSATGNAGAFDTLSEELKRTLVDASYTGPSDAAQLVQTGYSVFADATSTKSLGEVVHVDSTGTIGVAMIQQAALGSQKGNFVVRQVIQPDGTSAVQEDAAASNDGDLAAAGAEQSAKEYGPVLYVSTYRPDWFQGLDERTGNVLD
eukprot:gene8751-10353_t